MMMGQDQQTPPADAPTSDQPWYANPTEVLLNFLGDITYSTDAYTIRTQDGALIIDRTTNQPIAQITAWYNAECYRKTPATTSETVQRAWQRARRTLIRRVLARRLWRRRGSR